MVYLLKKEKTGEKQLNSPYVNKGIASVKNTIYITSSMAIQNLFVFNLSNENISVRKQQQKLYFIFECHNSLIMFLTSCVL